MSSLLARGQCNWGFGASYCFPHHVPYPSLKHLAQEDLWPQQEALLVLDQQLCVRLPLKVLVCSLADQLDPLVRDWGDCGQQVEKVHF